MPEPCPDILVEVTLSGRQDEPWTRRICRDGEVWEHTNLRTWVEAGEVRQEHQPLAWEQVTTAPPEALAMIESVIDRFGLRAAAPPPGAATVFGSGVTVWRFASHEIRLDNVPPDVVPGLRELDEAVQLAVAMGVSPD